MAVPVVHSDLLIIGAGLSGINSAHRLRELLPHRSLDILEGREVMGGTWNFFKYPGFRSDSSMTVFGFQWFPWTKYNNKIAAAGDIASYIEDAARSDGSYDKIKFRHKVNACEWNSHEQKWSLDVDADGTRKVFKANFVISCSGYYSYDRALEAVIPGIDDFGGTVAHTQWWPEGLDYSGKRVVVIGSGATAVTVIPELAKTAKQVTMLQRSPSYLTSMPTKPSAVESIMRAVLPRSWMARFSWFTEVFTEVFLTQFLLAFPAIGRWALRRMAVSELPKGFEVDVHFNPSYNPVEQRLCLCPDGDFFKALHQDNCDIVTDVVETVTKDGIKLRSGRHIPADIIVTATGLYFQIFGGMTPVCDGKPVVAGERYAWRGCMLESLPNMAFVFGYVTSSWTPGADAMIRLVAKVIQRMEDGGQRKVMPVLERHKGMTRNLAMAAKNNYFLKAADRIPKSTGEAPWYGRKNLLVDTWARWFASLDDGLEYSYGEESKKTN